MNRGWQVAGFTSTADCPKVRRRDRASHGLSRGNPLPFSVSRTGVLAYRTGAGTVGALNLTWFDRDGKTLGTAGEPGEYNTVSLSPDGSRVAASRTDGGNSDIWLHEFARGISTRLTFDPGLDWLAVWSPVSKGGGVEPRWRADGKELLYISPNSEMMAVAVSTNPTFAAAPPKALSHVPISGGGNTNNVTRYDVTADGKKFLVNALPSQGEAKALTPITVVLNWQAGLKK